jgi:ATP-binding cassette subfamily B protein
MLSIFLYYSNIYFRINRQSNLLVGLLAGSLLQLIFSFSTQSIADVGIQNQNINFINLILFAQLFLKTALELIRS